MYHDMVWVDAKRVADDRRPAAGKERPLHSSAKKSGRLQHLAVLLLAILHWGSVHTDLVVCVLHDYVAQSAKPELLDVNRGDMGLERLDNSRQATMPDNRLLAAVRTCKLHEDLAAISEDVRLLWINLHRVHDDMNPLQSQPDANASLLHPHRAPFSSQEEESCSTHRSLHMAHRTRAGDFCLWDVPADLRPAVKSTREGQSSCACTVGQMRGSSGEGIAGLCRPRAARGPKNRPATKSAQDSNLHDLMFWRIRACTVGQMRGSSQTAPLKEVRPELLVLVARRNQARQLKQSILGDCAICAILGREESKHVDDAPRVLRLCS